MSVKQDKSQARTVADLERKYNFGKTFAEMLGLINDSRDHVDSVESGLRNELTNEATSIRRDTQSIVSEAVRETVKTSEFEEYKESASAQLKITADGIQAKVDSATEQVTNIGGDLNTVKGQLEALEAEVDNIIFDENGQADITESFRREVRAELDVLDERITAEVSARTEKTTEIEADLRSLEGDVTANLNAYTTFKGETESQLDILDDRITAEVTSRTEERSQIDAEINVVKGNISDVSEELGEITESIGGLNTDIGNIEADVSALKTFKNESASRFDVLSNQITAEVKARSEETTKINADIVTFKGDVNGSLSEINDDITILNGNIAGINDTVGDINTDINGINTEMAAVKADITVLEEYRDESTTRLDLQEAQISAGVSRTEEVYTAISGTIEDTKNDLAEEIEIRKSFQSKTESDLSLLSDSMTLSFEKKETELSDVNGKVSSMETNLQKHFEFDLDGITIKAGENDLKLRLDNGMIAFYKGEIKDENRFGWWDGENFHTGNIKVAVNERAQFGAFAFVPRSNGSLDFKKVGD